MSKDEVSRRLFLAKSFASLSGGWLASRWPEILAAQEHVHRALQSDAPVKFVFFTPEQAAEVEAIAAQIIPSDDAAGAREAHVVYFIDRALATFDADKRPLYAKGLKQIEAKVRKSFSKNEKFSDLTAAQQIKLLKGIERSEFFLLVRMHTIMGYLANAEYGGNYDQAGWKAIGFEDQFFFKPPFGFYDRDYKEER